MNSTKRPDESDRSVVGLLVGNTAIKHEGACEETRPTCYRDKKGAADAFLCNEQNAP